MAFNFLSGQDISYDPFSPYQQSFYNDPRRQGAQGSFNPYALSNFNTMQKGGLQTDPTKQPTQPGGNQPPPLPTTNPTTPPGSGSQPVPGSPPSSGSRTIPGTPPPPVPGNPGIGGTPIKKPGFNGGTPNPAGNPGAINYSQYGSVQDVYANNPNGLPPGWDWNAWSAATGQTNPMTVTNTGEPINFTWNPNGPGFVNPYTGETFDKPGETFPLPPAPRPRR